MGPVFYDIKTITKETDAMDPKGGILDMVSRHRT